MKKCNNDNLLIHRYFYINARNKCTHYLRKAKQLYYSNLTSSNFRNDKLMHIKMSKLNTKIKYLSISGCILWNEFDLIIKNSITYSIFLY